MLITIRTDYMYLQKNNFFNDMEAMAHALLATEISRIMLIFIIYCINSVTTMVWNNLFNCKA